METMLPPAWEHHFQGSEGSKIIQKAIQNVTENSFRRQAASKSVFGGSWHPFWLPFEHQRSRLGSILEPFCQFGVHFGVILAPCCHATVAAPAEGNASEVLH